MTFLNDKNTASGLLFVAVGALGLFLSMRFQFGSTAQPGPGFFPILLSLLLILIGSIVAISGFLQSAEPIDRFAIRPFILITAAVATFSITIIPFGLLLSVFATAIVASFAKQNFGHLHRLLTAICLAGASALLFVGALNLPITLWAF